jgi:hypothetical protein
VVESGAAWCWFFDVGSLVAQCEGFARRPPVRCSVVGLITPEVNRVELEETGSQGDGFKRHATAGKTCMARFRRGSIEACGRHRKRAARSDWARARGGCWG